jgi:hypothetical protein
LESYIFPKLKPNQISLTDELKKFLTKPHKMQSFILQKNSKF